MRLGYVGLGDMGGALAARIASRHDVLVFDANPDAVTSAVEQNATAADSLADLGRACDVVMLCLPTSSHVRSVIFSPDGLAASMAGGSLIIDQTSGDPSETTAMAAELAEVGIDLVDAPVSGGAPGARAGTISMMLGAPERCADRATEALRTIGDNVTHVGAVGAGHTMKLVNNLISCSQRLVTLEALAIAAKQGIDPVLAVDILCKGAARNGFLEIQGNNVVTGAIDRKGGFSLGLAFKDLALACDLASTIGAPTFFGGLTRDLHRLAISQLGPDLSVETMAGLFESAAGVTIASKPQ